MGKHSDTPRSVTELDPRHPVLVFPVERDEAEDTDQDTEAAA